MSARLLGRTEKSKLCFKYNERSIAGCAFSHGIMVLYRSNSATSQLPAAWTLRNEPIASWSPSGFLVGDNDSFTCFYDSSGNTSHTNLFCMAAAPRGEEAEPSGILYGNSACIGYLGVTGGKEVPNWSIDSFAYSSREFNSHGGRSREMQG